MSEHRPLSGIQEEAQSNIHSRPTSQPTLLNVDLQADFQPHHDSMPASNHTSSQRRSSISNVEVAFFNPEGDRESRRPSTQHSEQEESTGNVSTDSTLAPKDGEPFDLAKTLRKVVQMYALFLCVYSQTRIEGFDRKEEHQIKPRELGVVFKDLRVVGLGASASYAQTLGSLFNPYNFVEALQNFRHPPVRDILSGFEGVVRPGEMIREYDDNDINGDRLLSCFILVVLGRPGSGCSTFLKTLANRRKEYYAIEGDVHYDSISPSELQSHYRGDVQYCPEDDVHFPTLTVEQTLKFAATTRTPRHRATDSREEYADRMTDVLTTVFGLRHTRNTPVGDHMVRGVSGGEKKRVSIAEALAARSCIGAWDK